MARFKSQGFGGNTGYKMTFLVGLAAGAAG